MGGGLMNIDFVLNAHGIAVGKSKDEVPPLPITNFTVASVGDGFVELSWTNPPSEDTDFVGVKIQRKTGGYPTTPSDGETAYDGTGITVMDSGLTNGVTYYYRAFTYDFDNNFNTDTGQQTNGTPIIGDDIHGIGGLYNLIAGDMQAGYFGTVSSSDFIDGDSLAGAVGLSAGISQYSTTDWLKFAYEGKILLRPMKAIRMAISWDSINDASVVFGDKTVTIGELDFKVRLMKGALTNPSKDGNPDRGAIGSEWNTLMLPIHEEAPSDWANPKFVNSPTEDWAVDFTDGDLLTHHNYGKGSYVWCQETIEGSGDSRVIRGYYGVSNSGLFPSSDSSSYLGWAPVLELVE
jgi:hypothetical protein